MKIDFKNDNTRAMEEMEGSDGRANVSSRADSRGYYNSRDQGLCFSLPYAHTSSEAGEFVAYWKNTSQTKALIISSAGINADNLSKFKLHYVTGTAAGGTSATPTNLSSTAPHAAEATAMVGGSAATGITGLTSTGVIDCARAGAGGHEEFRLGDRLRLGQNAAIAIEYDAGTAGDTDGVIFGYYE